MQGQGSKSEPVNSCYLVNSKRLIPMMICKSDGLSTGASCCNGYFHYSSDYSSCKVLISKEKKPVAGIAVGAAMSFNLPYRKTSTSSSAQSYIYKKSLSLSKFDYSTYSITAKVVNCFKDQEVVVLQSTAVIKKLITAEKALAFGRGKEKSLRPLPTSNLQAKQGNEICAHKPTDPLKEFK